MSGNRNVIPAGYYDDDDVEDHEDCFQPSPRPPQNRPPLNDLQSLDLDGVKIIPKLGFQAGLNKSDFDIQLEPNAQQWFDKIHNYWRQYKKSPVLSNLMQQFYASSPNPFEHALKFFANATDHPNPKNNSFAYTILDELANFKKTMNRRSDTYLNDNTKMVAFNFLKKSGQITAFRLVVDTFGLIESKELFVPEIRELITARMFKEAGQIACDLRLYSFTLDDFLIPLILEDRLGIFEDYLDKADQLRAPTIQLLDTFLNRDVTVRQICSEYIAKYDLTDVKYEKLHKKPVSKLITRLMKKYQLHESIAPNMKKHKEFGALHFILRKNYVEKSLNQASFEEMVKDTIAPDNKDLQAELVDFCMGYSLEDAVKWTKFYNVSLDDVAPLIRDKINGVAERPRIESGWDDDDDWDLPAAPVQQKPKELEVHTLPIDSSRIVLVNSVPSYHTMINDLRCTKMLAFDTEWKPTIQSCNDVSLIQLAKRDMVYLVDVISLIQVKLSDEEWSLLGRWIFNNGEILKLGFAHSTDILMLMKFQPLGIQSSQHTTHSYLDLQGLWQKVANFPDFKFPFHEDLPSHSLSNLVKLCFGKKLDKSNQFSNWQQRPLREEQISYAALDAFCLFEIFDVIGNVINGMGINYTELIDNILIENKKQIASMTKKDSRQQQQKAQTVEKVQNVIRSPITVRDIRFVTDFMIGGIGRVLRQVGIDTVILKGDYEDNDECIKYSQREDRVIITASKQLMVNRYQKHTKLGYSFLVNKWDNEFEGLEEIVKHFKINLKQQNVFSRCMVCNSDEFLVASKVQMIGLKFGNSRVPDQLACFLNVDKFNNIEFPEHKKLWNWTRYSGEKVTKYGKAIGSSVASVPDGTLRVFQTFYICERCSKIYWDGGHFQNNSGKLDRFFNLYPEAERE